MRRQEAEGLALGLLLVCLSVDLVLAGRRRVVDVTPEEEGRALLLHQSHRVVLVAALAAEVHRIQALVRVARKELLPTDRDLARPWRLDRCVDVTRSGDELVELEGEEALLAPAGVGRSRAFGDARYEEEVSQGLAAGFAGATRFARECFHGLGHGHGLGPDPSLVDLRERDAKPRLDPHRERVLSKRGICDLRRYAGVDGLAEVGFDRLGGSVREGDALERLADDVALRDRSREQL